MSIFSWNCQGVANPKFISTLKSFLHEFKPHVVILVEPRISGAQAEYAIKKIGYPYSHRVDALGFSGGIWLLWSSHVNVTIAQSHHQFIHAEIKWVKHGKSTFLTAVYGSPSPSTRERLWYDLSGLMSNTSGNWLLAGDFNAVLTSQERRGGRSSQCKGNKSFISFVESHSLVDLGFSGPQFTWRRGTLFARLDRALASMQ